MAEHGMSEIDQQLAIGRLQEQVEGGNRETNRRLDRIEKKIDEQRFVAIDTFEQYKKDMKEQLKGYVTTEKMRPMFWFFTIAGSAVIMIVVPAIVYALAKVIAQGGAK